MSRLLSILFCSLFLSAAAQYPSCSHSHHGSTCSIEPIYEDMFTSVPAPEWFSTTSVRTATFEVTYNGFTPQAQAAFQYAVDIWAATLTSDVTIRLDATFASLGQGVLGSAGPANLFDDFPGAEVNNVFYPSALADKLRGIDLDPGQPDLVANFNNTTNWYYGTDANPPSGTFDFVSVVLHELGHGLGIVGSATVDGNQGSYGFGFNSQEIIWDRFTVNASSQAVLDFQNNSTTLADVLQSGALFWNGPLGVEANQGQRPRLFAPDPWQQGSSYSHLNEQTYGAGNPNSLMTPQIGQAEAIHSPGPLLLGMMDDMGWEIQDGAGDCIPNGLTLSAEPCATDDNGTLLPVVNLNFSIIGGCLVNELCFTIDGGAPNCFDLQGLGFDIANGEGINLTELTPDADYVFYYSVDGGAQSGEFAYNSGNCESGGGCQPINLTATDAGCNDSGNGLLPRVQLQFEIDGDCEVADLCWAPTPDEPVCANLPDNGFNLGDGEGINLIDLIEETEYEIYFTTTDGQSASIFYTTPSCAGEIEGCTDPLATNFNPAATVDDGSCIYEFTICDCAGTEHTAGVLDWIGDNYPDDGSFDWEDQPVDFNCETWGYDCGDFDGGPTDDPFNVCGGDLPPNNGCEGGGCTPTLLTIVDGGCNDNGNGVLAVMNLTFSIDGDCDVADLCWAATPDEPVCVNLPLNGFDLGDGEGINLIDLIPNTQYEVYFTTEDGQSQSVFFTTTDCDGEIAGCTDPLATNYDPAATVDDGSCIYDFTICDCAGTEHTVGVLDWLGDGYADDGSFDWEGQPVDFNCETWGFDCGDVDGAPDLDPNNVCGGDLPPNNGCEGGDDCLPVLLTATSLDCVDNGNGLLAVLQLGFEIDGDCDVADLCWAPTPGTPACVNLPGAGFNLGDGEGINLVDLLPNTEYEIYFTTTDGESTSILITTASCGEEVLGCTDEDALNFDPLATEDDGSCIYDCDFPTAVFSPFCEDGDNDNYYVLVEVSSIGTQGPFSLSDSQGVTDLTVSAAADYTAGPFSNGSPTVITMTSDQFESCVFQSGTIKFNCVSSIGELSAAGMAAWPNPFEDVFTLDLGTAQECEVILHDMQGRVVYRAAQLNGRHDIMTSQLERGIYQLTIVTDAQTFGKTMMKY